MPFELKIAAACAIAIVLALTGGCTAVPDASSAEIKKCEGTSSQRLRELKTQRYAVQKCKL